MSPAGPRAGAVGCLNPSLAAPRSPRPAGLFPVTGSTEQMGCSASHQHRASLFCVTAGSTKTVPTSPTLGGSNEPSRAAEKRFALYLPFLLSQCSNPVCSVARAEPNCLRGRWLRPSKPPRQVTDAASVLAGCTQEQQGIAHALSLRRPISPPASLASSKPSNRTESWGEPRDG